MATNNAPYTVPGLTEGTGHQVGELLQLRLHALNDLQLTLKHAHWNVVGPSFISVHEMLDPQIELVRGFADEVAERMSTLGVSPQGTPGNLVAQRSWEDYPVGRADTTTHLEAINKVYDGVIEDHRAVITKIGELDPITEDLLISQTAELEKFQWFVRAHLENAQGDIK